MKLRLTDRAHDDLDGIYAYLSVRSPQGARQILQHIYLALNFIETQPHAAERTEKAHVRVKIVSRYRYKIFYTASGDAIDILYIRHGARDAWQP